MTYSELVTELESLAKSPSNTDGDLAYLGFATGSYSIRVSGKPNYVWVRLAESDERTPVQALNLAQVRILPDLPVRVRVVNKRLSIIGYDPTTIDEFFSGAAIETTSPDSDITSVIATRQILPGLVHAVQVSGVYGMTVQIEGFYYTNDITNQKAYFPTTTVDLTSYIPASANQHKYVIVGVDQADNSASVLTGTAKAITVPMLPADIESVTLGNTLALGAVRLVYGMTAINQDYYFVDIRPWVTQKSEPLATYTPTILTLSTGAVTATQTAHIIAAESGTADDLDTITAASEYTFIVVQADSGDTITVKHGTGNIALNNAVDVILAGDQKLMLYYDGTNWADVAPAPALVLDTTDVSNPPTDAELDAAYGTPATVGAGFMRLLDDAGGDANVYVVVSNGTSWWYTALTKAT